MIQNDLQAVIKAQSKETSKLFPKGSFRRLFWDEQLKMAKLKMLQVRMAPNDDPLVFESQIAIIVGILCITNIWISEVAVREDPS